MTVSHLRFGPRPIHSTYLIGPGRPTSSPATSSGSSSASTSWTSPTPGATFLLNSPYGPDDGLGAPARRGPAGRSSTRGCEFYVVDAQTVAQRGGTRPADQHDPADLLLRARRHPRHARRPIAEIKAAIEKTLRQARRAVVEQNFAAVDARARRPSRGDRARRGDRGDLHRLPPVPDEAPDFVQRVTAMMIAGKGDLLPVTAMPVDGTFPTDTAQWEKRSDRAGDPDLGPGDLHRVRPSARWSARTPRSAMKVYEPLAADRGCPTSVPARRSGASEDDPGTGLTIQVAPDDCTGCGVCVDVCPAESKEVVKHKAINMEPKLDHLRRRSGRTSSSSSTSPSSTARDVKVATDQGLADAPAAVRVLRRLRRLRRDAVPEAADPALRRPDRWSPTPPAARRSTAATCRRRRGQRTRTAAGPPGPTRCSRTTPSSASGMRLAVDQQASYARALLAAPRRRAIGDDLAAAILEPTGRRGGIAAPARARRAR